MAVFDGVCYSLSPTLSSSRRSELAAILDLNGAVSHPPYTHLVALPASHAHNTTSDQTVKLVTDRWVDRSFVLGKCQPEQYYSPDPAMIFSGVVACATDLSVSDLEVLSAGITALGGQWRIGLTRDVTHLFALRPGSDKYNTALHFASQTHMCILTPHWFDDAVRLGRRIPETPYAWPDPPVLRPGMSLDLDDDALAIEGKRRRKLPADAEAEAGNSTSVLPDGEQARVWAGRRILFSNSLELGPSSRSAIETRVRRAGGIVLPAADDAEEKAVDECDVFITRWRSGRSYFKAARASLLIGTLAWLFSVESSGTLHSPLDSLLWYPTPRGGIPGLIDSEISITNYTGAARDYLKRLIDIVGAKFTPSMSQSNKVLVAGFQPSPKTTRALSWSIPVVNHTWLEDCIVEWRALTVGLERYIMFPPGIDFGKMLVTRPDEPPSSQSVPIPRLAWGGAVPGGRGVGVVDVEREEIRDAEYRAGARADGGLSTARGNDTAADGVATTRVEDDVQPKSRAQSHSRAGSVKKTPSSTARARRGSVSTPSATGAFVDHVIELPADDDDVGGQGTPANGKRRAQAARATPRSSSRASSVGLFSTSVEVVVPNSSRGGKGKGKDTGKRETRPAEEADDEEVAQPARPPKSKTRLIQHRSDPKMTETEDEVVKQAPAQTSKPRRRASKGVTDGPDSDSDESEISVPPRRVPTRSMTPVRSRMKPRSGPTSRPSSVLGGESETEVRTTAAKSGRGKRREQVAKTTHSRKVVTQEKASEGKKKEAEKTASSPTSAPDAKNTRTPKRRLSVNVPPVPKDYFSSQNVRGATGEEGGHEEEERGTDAGATSESRSKQLKPAASVHLISAEASTSTSKRGKPRSAKSSTIQVVPRDPEPQPKPKSKPGRPKKVTKTHANDGEEGDNDAPMIVDTPLTSTSRGGPRRSAADKAITRLSKDIMPDVINFEKEQKQTKRKRSENWELVASGKGKEGVEERGAKRRKMASEEEMEEEEEEEAEVEEVVLVPSVKAKRKPANGKGKAKGGHEEATDDSPPTKNKLSGSEEKKGGRGRGKDSTVIRLMTTGVVLSDDIVKRLSKLGVQMTTKPTECTHLIAKGIVRTEKFLCAMPVSPYILTEGWASASAKGGKLLPEKDYLLSDAAAEQKWAFKLVDAMARVKGPAGGASLFKEMTFYVTPKVGVDAKLLKNVVSAGGGQVQTSTPTARILKGKTNRYVVSCPEDKGIWWPLVREGFKVYSPELVLRGALRQEIEWEREECLVAG